MDLSLSSRLVHADEFVSTHRAVAPALHVSTTFRYHNDPDLLDPENNVDVRQDSISTPKLPLLIVYDSQGLLLIVMYTLARATPTAHVSRPFFPLSSGGKL